RPRLRICEKYLVRIWIFKSTHSLYATSLSITIKPETRAKWRTNFLSKLRESIALFAVSTSELEICEQSLQAFK
ncbi:MAG: hypothetical protein ABI583_15950, partial [Betaproteobacteria bacterium]